MPGPILTLTTDFGTTDAYVAQVKLAALRWCPEATFVDVTHEVPPRDIAAGAFALERAVAVAPAEAIHVAVVDPGVGTDRRLLVCHVGGQRVLCPDNGLITWTHRRHHVDHFEELLWRPQAFGHTFHGRDVLAPAAAKLAVGHAVPVRPIPDPELLDHLALAKSHDDVRVIHVDRYGNCCTNLPASQVFTHLTFRARPDARPAPVRATYGDVAPGAPVALINSADLLELAIRDGDAAQVMGLKVGDKVEVMA